jgi:hypothetical protein
MPDPAVTGPFTGGQKVAQVPLHFEAVEVSGTNQYSVMPLALVSTEVPLMVVLPTVPPLEEPELAPAPAVAPVVGGELLLELAQADRAMARAASPAAPTIFRIRILPFSVLVISTRNHVPNGC